MKLRSANKKKCLRTMKTWIRFRGVKRVKSENNSFWRKQVNGEFKTKNTEIIRFHSQFSHFLCCCLINNEVLFLLISCYRKNWQNGPRNHFLYPQTYIANQGLISPTYYEKILCAEIPKAQKIQSSHHSVIVGNHFW